MVESNQGCLRSHRAQILQGNEEQSIIVGLTVVPYNQNKHANVFKYLDWLQKFFQQVIKCSGNDDLEDQENDQSDGEELDEKHLIQIPIVGDLLGRERITGAKKLRKGCDKTSERFENMTETAEYWHAKQAFLIKGTRSASAHAH